MMKINRNSMMGAGTILALCLAVTPLGAQTPTGQWDFNAGDLSAATGASMDYYDGAGGSTQLGTSFGTTTSFGIADIAGAAAKVMKFPAITNGMGYTLPTPAGNGGGGLVNDYTIVFDVYYPSESDGKVRSLILTDSGAATGKKKALVVGASNGIGSDSGPFHGSISPNTWHRIGFVVNSSAGLMREYIDGNEVGSETIGSVDSSYALDASATVLVLANEDSSATGYVNSIQIRDVALNAGQMMALGAPSAAGIPQTIPAVPSFVESRTPGQDAVNVAPKPDIQITLNRGDTTVTAGSIKLYFDDTLVPSTVTPSVDTQAIAYSAPAMLSPSSIHDLSLVYQDSVAGLKTNTWSFTVQNYQNVILPAPIYLETFDALDEASLPNGWSVTNNTVSQSADLDLTNPKSDSYLDFVTITTDTLSTYFDHRRLQLPPIVVNGQLLDSLVSGNLLWAESDQRQNAGGQVNVAFTPDYDLTGKSNIFLSFHSIYEQNQDNIASVEYSINQGVTWLPALYHFDNGISGGASDIVTNNGVIDVFATFGTARSDQSWGMAYSNYIGAVVSTNLAPYIVGRLNDDPIDGKRVEVIRLPKADGQSKVRFRLGQAGTSSWYFGVDDFGIYSINTPVITAQPLTQTIDATSSVTFSVSATGNPPLAYQWQLKGKNIAGATNSTLTISNVSSSNAGQYQVVVSNTDGPTTSNPATLTVVTKPQIVVPPVYQIASPGATAAFNAQARGGQPLSLTWNFNGTPLSGASGNVLTLPNVQTGNSGLYALVAKNSYGSVTSVVAQLVVFGGSITNDLVTHLTFDGNYADTSGRGNDATPVGSPGFATGKLGKALSITTKKDGSDFSYASLGSPADLLFGDAADFSISLWVNVTNQVDDPAFISNKDWNSSGNRGWGIFAQGGGNTRINITGPNGGSDKLDTSSTPSVRDGHWHNIVLSVVRGQFAYIFTDGLLVNTSVYKTVGNIDTDDLGKSINIGQDGTGSYTDGGSAEIVNALIDDVGIWRRALTPQEASAIYNAGLAGKDLSHAGSGTVSDLGKLSIAATGGALSFTWTASSSVRLQKSASLNPAAWQDVAGTEGKGAWQETANGNGAAFYRLVKP
jgi:hypothetical protein